MDKLKEAIIRNVFGVLLYWLAEFSSEISPHVKKNNTEMLHR